MLVKLIKKGAEADIYTGMWKNSKSIFKIRKIKNYRNALLDSKIRKQRTIKESQVLSQVKSFGIPSPLVYFVNLKKSMIVLTWQVNLKVNLNTGTMEYIQLP